MSRHADRRSPDRLRHKSRAPATTHAPIGPDPRVGELADAPRPTWFDRRSAWLFVAALLIAHFTMAALSARNKSPVYDELCHVTRAVTYAQLGDYRMDPTHGPLVHHWVGLPLRFMKFNFPDLNQRAWRHGDVWNYGWQLFHSPRLGNDMTTALYRARLMIALISVAGGLIVFLWSRRLFGAAGGLISLTAYAFDPTMLSHGRLVTTDLAAAVFLLAAMYALWNVSHRVTPVRVLAAVLAVGGLFLTKFSAVLIVIMGAWLIAVRLASSRPILLGRAARSKGMDPPSESPQTPPPGGRVIQRRTAKAGVLLCLTLLLVPTTGALIWAGYGFRWLPFKDAPADVAGYEADAVAGKQDYYYPHRPERKESAWTYVSNGFPPLKARTWRWLHESRLLPDTYVYGFMALLRSATARDAFMNGERSVTGWASFFPYAFLVKTPLPLIALLVLAVCAALWGPGRTEGAMRFGRRLTGSLYATAPLWILLSVYGVTSITSSINIGHRHLLPVYPALFVFAGAAARWIHATSIWKRCLPAASLVPLAASSLQVHPHYLAYFNLIAGGPSQGYKRLVDSSLDWGQDLRGLVDWLQAHRPADGQEQRVFLEYFGQDAPSKYPVKFEPIIRPLSQDGRGDLRLGRGTYCISATKLQGLYLLSGRDYASGLPRSTQWRQEHEVAYQALLPKMREIESMQVSAAARLAFLQAWRPDWREAFDRFQRLRFLRLCATLRTRVPDAMIGYSILVFDLTDDDIQQMAYGTPPQG